MAHVPRKRQLCDSRIVKRIAAFPSILIAMILAAPCRNHPGLLSAAERPNSQQQTERQQSQPESKPASAATFGVGGVAHTADGAPVPGATVRFTNTDTNQVWVSWTDPSGKFEFPALPAGPYRAEASQLGFVSSSLELQLGAGPAAPSMQFTLRVATLAQLTEPAGGGKSANPPNRRRAARQQECKCRKRACIECRIECAWRARRISRQRPTPSRRVECNEPGIGHWRFSANRFGGRVNWGE